MLQCFGQKEGYEGETYSHYACQKTQSHMRRSILVTVQYHEGICLFIKQLILQITIEISYLIKHVELHGRGEERNPWSVRQMGVYYRDDNKHGNTFVVLNPSRAFQRRLKAVRQTLPIPSAHDIHILILSSATSSWRWCITDMEKNYESMVCNTTSRAKQYLIFCVECQSSAIQYRRAWREMGLLDRCLLQRLTRHSGTPGRLFQTRSCSGNDPHYLTAHTA